MKKSFRILLMLCLCLTVFVCAGIVSATETISAEGGELKNGEYKLNKDVILSNPLTIKGTNQVTIDLNGHTLSYSTDSESAKLIQLEDTSSLTVKDGSGTNNGKIAASATTGNAIGILNSSTGTVTVSGGTVSATSTNSLAYGISNGSTGSVTVSGGTVSAKSTEKVAYGIYAVAGSVTVNGGTVDASSMYAAYGIWNVNGSLNVSNGTISADNKTYYSVYVIFASGKSGSTTLSGTPELKASSTGGGIVYNLYCSQSVTFTDYTGEKLSVYTGSAAKLTGKMSQIDTGKSKFAGGLFSEKPTEACAAAAGYMAVSNTEEATKKDYPWTVIPYTIALSNGEVYKVTDNGDGAALGEEDKAILGISCNKDTATYTFTNVNFTSVVVTPAAVTIRDTSAVIILAEENSITGKSQADDLIRCGLRAEGNLTFQGTGSLTATGGVTKDGTTYGLSVGGKLTVDGDASVTAVGGEVSPVQGATGTSYGVYAASEPTAIAKDGDGTTLTYNAEAKIYKDGEGVAAKEVVLTGLPAITLGSQSGPLTYGTAGSATYTVTDERFTPSDHQVSWTSGSAPAGVSVSFDEENDKLTVTTTAATPAGEYKFKVTAEDTTSAEATLTVDKALPGKDNITLTKTSYAFTGDPIVPTFTTTGDGLGNYTVKYRVNGSGEWVDSVSQQGIYDLMVIFAEGTNYKDDNVVLEKAFAIVPCTVKVSTENKSVQPLDKLTVKADISGMQEGYKLVWDVTGSSKWYPVEISEENNSITIVACSYGTLKITARVVDAEGNTVENGDGTLASDSTSVDVMLQFSHILARLMKILQSFKFYLGK